MKEYDQGYFKAVGDSHSVIVHQTASLMDEYCGLQRKWFWRWRRRSYEIEATIKVLAKVSTGIVALIK